MAAQSELPSMAGAAAGALARAARDAAPPTRDKPTVATKSRRFRLMRRTPGEQSTMGAHITLADRSNNGNDNVSKYFLAGRPTNGTSRRQRRSHENHRRNRRQRPAGQRLGRVQQPVRHQA